MSEPYTNPTPEPSDRSLQKKRVLAVFEIVGGGVLLFMRDWTVFHVVPAPWVGGALIAFGVALLLFPGWFREM